MALPEFDASDASDSTTVGESSPSFNPPNAGPGVNSLNALTNANLTIEFGSTGTDANIVAATDTITLHIPSASASNRGLVTTGAQTIAGAKTFSGAAVFSSTVAATGLVTATAGVKEGATVLTPGATVAMDLDSGNVFTLTPGETCTINASNIAPGRVIKLIILTSGTSSFTITFGTGFKSTGTLATGTADGKYFVVEFVTNATLILESSRTTAM